MDNIISPMGVDAFKTSKEFIEQAKPPQIDIEGILEYRVLEQYQIIFVLV